MSEELNNIKFIQKFDDLKVSNNSEKNNDLKDIINNTLLLPLNKRIEKRLVNSNKKENKKTINYPPKKRKKDGVSKDRIKSSCSRKKKRVGNNILNNRH